MIQTAYPATRRAIEPAVIPGEVAKSAIDALDVELQAAREHARRLTAMYGTGHRDVAVAWDGVEELLVAKARRRERALSSFERYCLERPDAVEARIYDV